MYAVCAVLDGIQILTNGTSSARRWALPATPSLPSCSPTWVGSGGATEIVTHTVQYVVYIIPMIGDHHSYYTATVVHSPQSYGLLNSYCTAANNCAVSRAICSVVQKLKLCIMHRHTAKNSGRIDWLANQWDVGGYSKWQCLLAMRLPAWPAQCCDLWLWVLLFTSCNSALRIHS